VRSANFLDLSACCLHMLTLTRLVWESTMSFNRDMSSAKETLWSQSRSSHAVRVIDRNQGRSEERIRNIASQPSTREDVFIADITVIERVRAVPHKCDWKRIYVEAGRFGVFRCDLRDGLKLVFLLLIHAEGHKRHWAWGVSLGSSDLILKAFIAGKVQEMPTGAYNDRGIATMLQWSVIV
jgi:hypothetical protein